MGRLAKKYGHLVKAITSFEQALLQHAHWQTTIEPEKVESLGIDYKGIATNLRDSMIQRFEYSTDLLWKYLKVYLDEQLHIIPDIISPNAVIREACKARLLSEQEAKILYVISRLNTNNT